MDKTRAAAKQANAIQRLAEHLPGIADRLSAIEQQLAVPAGAAPLLADLVEIEPMATAAQLAALDRRLDELYIGLMPAADLARKLDSLADQLAEIKALLTKQPPQQRR